MTMKQDVVDITKFILEFCNHKGNNYHRVAVIVPRPLSNRSNEPKYIQKRIKSGQQSSKGSSRHHLSQSRAPSNPVPASTNLLNNGTKSAWQVSNDSRLALKAGPNPEPDPSVLPADPPTSASRTRYNNELACRGTDVDVA